MKRIPETAKRWINQWIDPANRWLSIPCTVAALLVMLVMVKSCQGIVYSHSDECRIYRLGYSIDEARSLIAALSQQQIDSLIARQEHDTIATALLNERYFIAGNFEYYLALHKVDTTATLPDIIAVVNTGDFPDKKDKAAHCDTTKGYLMLVNGLHYLDKHYKPDSLVKFTRDYCYENQRAVGPAVEAFVAMQHECKRQTGAHLMVNSAYRSYEDQMGTYKRNDKRYVALPGNSEHQTGLAIDATSLQHPEKWSFGKSEEGVWTREHCHEYGFIVRYPEKQAKLLGYSYEPWHLRYVGKEVARRIHDEGITFDEYYAYYIDNSGSHAESPKH